MRVATTNVASGQASGLSLVTLIGAGPAQSGLPNLSCELCILTRSGRDTSLGPRLNIGMCIGSAMMNLPKRYGAPLALAILGHCREGGDRGAGGGFTASTLILCARRATSSPS